MGLALTLALITVAGAVGYLIAASGASGPMVFIGQSDATTNARDAWLQLPIHAALGVLMVAAAWEPARAIAARLALGLAAVLVWWGLALTIFTLSGLGASTTDAFDVAVAVALLGLYLAIVWLIWARYVRPLPAPVDARVAR